MTRTTALLGVLLLTAPLHAGEPKSKLLVDLWDAAYLEGGKAGHVRTTVHEMTRDGQKRILTTIDLNLTLKRNDDVIQLRAITATEETPAGKVTGTYMKQQLGPKSELVVAGVVTGKELRLTLQMPEKKQALKPAPWDDRVVGLYRQQQLFKEYKVQPGDRFSYLSFEPTVNLVVNTNVAVKDYEVVMVDGGKAKKRLLRAEVKPDKIENTVLPTVVYWLDEDRQIVRSQVDIPGLGKMTLYRTTRELATAPGKLATLTDVGVHQLVKLTKRIPQPYDTTKTVFRITLKGEDDPATAFAQDGRQIVFAQKGNVIDLQVQATRGPKPNQPAAKVAAEFLQNSYFITCDDAQVKAHARKAVGAETDPWKKALLIERWVYQNMKSANDEALTPADKVARTLRGDCTEFAMLAAAMCRAEGVPARTAIGLIYADTKTGPALAFHMWTEVWVRDQWVPIDATLGRGYVGATHLKITDHSWHETQTLTPLLPLLRVLGKMSVEVVRVE
jgi:hypothetical protein